MFGNFNLKGNRSCLRTDDEINSINKEEADSSFEIYKKKYIDTLLMSKGFFKYKTNGYVRCNNVDVLEYIGLQKERYGSKTFTVNCALTPLYIHYDFPQFISDERIGKLILQEDVWWDYVNAEIANVSFANVANAIETFVIPWFDGHSTDDSIKEMLLLKQHNRGYLSLYEQTWLERIDNNKDCSTAIRENAQLFALPKRMGLILGSKEHVQNVVKKR